MDLCIEASSRKASARLAKACCAAIASVLSLSSAANLAHHAKKSRHVYIYICIYRHVYVILYVYMDAHDGLHRDEVQFLFNFEIDCRICSRSM